LDVWRESHEVKGGYERIQVNHREREREKRERGAENGHNDVSLGS
jgi:hypothetical protein